MGDKKVFLDDVFEYIETHKDWFLEELRPLIEQRSISTTNEGVEECALLLAKKLKEYGLNNVNIYPTEGRPVVFGEIIEDASYPTMLMYGHYDVQPADIEDGWNTDPFNPRIRIG